MRCFKTLIFVLLFAINMPAARCHVTNMSDGISHICIKVSSVHGAPKTNSIQATIDGHTLSVVFLENLGQVTIDVSLVAGGEVETQSTPTPNGVNIYIPNTGSYVVTFTLTNGDVYYGEFQVTD